MNRNKIIFRSILGVIAVGLVLTALQFLFDVPIFGFFRDASESLECCIEGEQPRLSLTASYEDGIQKAEGDVTISAYPTLTVQRGIPVEFILHAESFNIDVTNEYLSFPDFGIIDLQIKPGANTVRFYPDSSGIFFFSSRSGTLKSSVTVVESLGFPLAAEPGDALSQQQDKDGSPLYESPAAASSLDGWLEQQLTPSSGAEGMHEIKTWTGWVFDRDCVGIDPVRHTKACNLMGKCFDSGLGIFEYILGKAPDSYTALDTFLVFDGASKELAAEFLRTLPEEWRDNVTVTVTGYAVNNIPASTDELLIPETDSARISHYLNGIHVTSIELAYIDGVSTYQLPSPNIVMTQP